MDLLGKSSRYIEDGARVEAGCWDCQWKRRGECSFIYWTVTIFVGGLIDCFRLGLFVFLFWRSKVECFGLQYTVPGSSLPFSSENKCHFVAQTCREREVFSSW